MPIYEYICEKCGSHIEVLQRISDAPLKRCATCRGRLEKTVSRTSFQLKGSGWYVTDYSSKDSSAGKGAPVGTDKAEKVSDKKAATVSSTAASGDSD
ncbi:MAG TPA: FmdB family zinc ribbon protein [Blastocatellia bacterium]|nr:FmdB family zinc ribbon protein [Blastocatellia bacterium]